MILEFKRTTKYLNGFPVSNYFNASEDFLFLKQKIVSLF